MKDRRIAPLFEVQIGHGVDVFPVFNVLQTYDPDTQTVSKCSGSGSCRATRLGCHFWPFGVQEDDQCLTAGIFGATLCMLLKNLLKYCLL
jgi:hypothetical protein